MKKDHGLNGIYVIIVFVFVYFLFSECKGKASRDLKVDKKSETTELVTTDVQEDTVQSSDALVLGFYNELINSRYVDESHIGNYQSFYNKILNSDIRELKKCMAFY